MATHSPISTPHGGNGKFHFHLEGFQEKLCNNLYSMWQTSQLCDLTLRLSGGDEIHTHSCLLAAFSPTLADILSKMDNRSNDREDVGQKYVIDVKKFSADTMRIIVSTIYTGTVVVSTENMEQLLDACRWLKMEALIILLEKAVRERNSKSIEQSIKPGFSSNYSKLFSGSDDLSSPLSFEVHKELQEETIDCSLKECAYSSKMGSSNGSSWNSNTQQEFQNKNIKTTPKEGTCSSDTLDNNDCNLNSLQVLANVSSIKSISANSASTLFSKTKPRDTEDSSTQENGNRLQEPSKGAFSMNNYVDKILSSLREMGNCLEDDDNNDVPVASTAGVSHKQLAGDAAAIQTIGDKEGSRGQSETEDITTRRVDSSQENVQFTNPLTPASKMSESESEMGAFAGSNNEQRQFVRKGNHPRKKSQQWVESFLTNLYSRDKTFLEAVVPQIKTEVNDLESCPSSSYDQSGVIETRQEDGKEKRLIENEKERKEFLMDASDNDLSVTFEADQDGSAVNRLRNEANGVDNTASSLSNYTADRLSFIDFYNNQDYSTANAAGDGQGTGEKKCLKRRRTGQRKMPFYHVKKRRVPLPISETTASIDPEMPVNDVHEDDEFMKSAPVDQECSADADAATAAVPVVGGDDDNTRSLAHSKAHTEMEKMKAKTRRPRKPVKKKGKKDMVYVPKKKMKSTGTQVSLGDEHLKKKVKKEKVVKRKKKEKVVMLSTRVPTPRDGAAASGSTTLVNPSISEDDQVIKQAENDVLRRIENGEAAKCIKCRLLFKEADKYKAHINNHPIYPCPDCPAKFYLKHPMTRHRYSAHFDKSYLHCKECSFQAKTAKELCLHCGAEHGQPRPFNCEYAKCFYRADKYSDLQKHITEIHGTKMEYFCEKCGSGFTYKALFTQHKKRCLRNETHLCHRCGSVFHTKQDLNHHVAAVHFNIKKYKCPQCDHTFASHSNLKRHLYIHNNIFPFSCPHCDQKFRHSNTFKMHMESKHNKPHAHHDNNGDNQMGHGSEGYLAATKLNSLINPWATFDPRHAPNGHLYSMFF